MNFLPLALLLATATAQDTHFCADGWDLYTTTWHGEEHHSCFWFGHRDEQMSFQIAQLACNSMGAFLAEVPYGASLNHWIVEKLLVRDGKSGAPNYGVQYWLGAKDHGHHNEHVPGEWVWENRNTTVQWFDWGEDEPNNFHGQSCLTYLLYENIFGYKDFKWNDWDCDVAADFICEKIID